jgi:hypothetical protein
LKKFHMKKLLWNLAHETRAWFIVKARSKISLTLKFHKTY